MSNAAISVESKNWITTVTLDSPPNNYLDKDVLAKLNKTMSEVSASRADLRVVLITAKGKNFSAGIDYAGFTKMTKDEAGHFAEVGYYLLPARGSVWRLPRISVSPHLMRSFRFRKRNSAYLLSSVRRSASPRP
jgi:hypothetical protein